MRQKHRTEFPEALFALSADPWTLGHSSVLEKAKNKYKGRVLVGIANDSKKDYLFPQWARLRLAQKSLPDMDPGDIRLVPGSLARYLMREDVPTLIRGVRDQLDAAAEDTLAFYYLEENPDLKIDIMYADRGSKYAKISSTGVKASLQAGNRISRMVTSTVKQALESRLIGQYPVCVTGEMGAGKSTISRELVVEAEKLGIPCIYVDFDSLAHDIYGTLTNPYYAKVRREIRDAFGDGVMGTDGFVDRAALAQAVWGNKKKLAKLNRIMEEPLMFRYGDVILWKRGIILVDGALLVEFGITHLGNHHALIVSAPVEARVPRVIARDAKNGKVSTPEQVLGRFSKQMDGVGKTRGLEKAIQENHNGSVTPLWNDSVLPDPKKTLFKILAKIDTYGELRTKIILNSLHISDLDAEAGYAELKKKHEETHRYYHTWEHIVELLDHLFGAVESENLSDEEIGIIGAAILFHDSVYVVDKVYYRDNEIHSAELARSWLEARRVNPKLSRMVYALVSDTAHASGRQRSIPKGMDATRFDHIADLLHDFDMAILGSSPERYALYVNDIIAEFGIYPGREFVKGRIELLEKWIADDNLFRTEYGKRTFLEPARRNMREELARLKTMA